MPMGRRIWTGPIRGYPMDILTDLWGFMKSRKKYWLLPVIVTLLFLGTIIIFSGGSAIAPFIYALF